MRAPLVATSTAVLAALAAMTFSTESQAALINCPASFTADGTAKVYYGAAPPQLSAASACQYIIPPDNNEVANEENVNEAAFFGINTWEITSVNQVDANASSGTWTIPNVDFVAFDYMITFKDGQGTNLVSFLFNEEASTGSWLTPFTDPPFDLPGMSTSHEVSHYSIFRVGEEPNGVPEPSTLAVLGVGLLGLGALARRRRSS